MFVYIIYTAINCLPCQMLIWHFVYSSKRKNRNNKWQYILSEAVWSCVEFWRGNKMRGCLQLSKGFTTNVNEREDRKVCCSSYSSLHVSAYISPIPFILLANFVKKNLHTYNFTYHIEKLIKTEYGLQRQIDHLTFLVA